MAAAVDVMLQNQNQTEKVWLQDFKVRMHLYFVPDSDDLAHAQIDRVDLRNEDGGDGLVQRSPVHVDGRSDRKHEATDATVNFRVLLQTRHRDGQRGGAARRTREVSPGEQH